MIISFPGGCGGNWLRTVIDNEPALQNNINFHKHSVRSSVSLVHSLDPTEFDVLYSGSYYFNFYVNVLYKHFHTEENLFKTNYKDSFFTSVNTARFICRFDTIRDLTFFDFNDLVDQPEIFYQQLVAFSKKYNISAISSDEFDLRKQQFFKTMINVDDLYENFDNMIWVCFVLGQLMNKDVVPTDFAISEKQNQDKCKQFAKDCYHLCDLKLVWKCKSNVIMPDLL